MLQTPAQTMPQLRPDRTLGPGHDAFWNWCAKGELRLQRCTSCHAIAWPVTSACEHCGARDFDWQRMSGRGTLFSWCTFEQDYYRGVLPMPWDTVLAELEEGPLFISNPKGFSLDEAVIGMPVRLAFIACQDQAGEFSLPVFERG